MKKRTALSALVSSLLCVASGVFAQTSSLSAAFSDIRWQPYIQGAVTSTRLESPSNAGNGMDLGGVSKSTSSRATLGVQFKDYLGIEGTWVQLPRSTVTGRSADATYDGSAYFAQLIASATIVGNVQAVARFGAGRSDVKVDVPKVVYSSVSNRNLLVAGVGVRVNLQKSLSLTVDYDDLGVVGNYKSADSVKASLFSMGLKYKF